MGGQPVGSTPFSINLMPGWYVYSVRAPDHWTESFLVNIKTGDLILNEVDLKKIYLPTIERPDVSKERNLYALEKLYDSLTKAEFLTTPDSMCAAGFANNFPLIEAAPYPLTEKSPQYHEYYEVYDNEKMRSFREWYAKCSTPSKQNFDYIIDRIKELGLQHINGFAPVVAARFEPTTTDKLQGNLTLIFQSKDKRTDVAWQGAWDNSFLTGDDLVKALTASEPAALPYLTVQNQTAWVPIEEGVYSRHFFKYYHLSISWNGLLVPMEGKFILPDYLIEEPEVAEWLASAEPAKGEMPRNQNYVYRGYIYEGVEAAIASVAKIPGGTFEYKGKNTYLKPFEINTSQINQSLYLASCSVKDFGEYKGDSIPAHSVSWSEASSCCEALGGDLPTEAEWEYAARAGSPYEYAWLNNAADYAVFERNNPIRIASKKPNGWGLYDMFGNVSEWVKDDGFWFGKYKFLKGGNYKSKEKDLKVKNSQEEDVRYWGPHVGFRCVFR
jgi:hypothetical protein